MGAYINHNCLINMEAVIFETNYHWMHFFTKEGFLSLFILPLIQKYTSEFVVTNHRIILKFGWLIVDLREMNLNKIEAVTIHQTIIGRALGYGDITITGSGGTQETACMIKDPILFRRRFLEVQHGDHYH